MTADPRASLATLVSALERHLEVASSRRDPDDLSVMAAAQELATAFDDYDEALFQATDVATPLAIYDGPFDDDDDDDDGRPDIVGAEAGVYSGLEDVDLDYGDDGPPAGTAVAATTDDADDDDDFDDDDDDDEDDDDDDDEDDDEDDDDFDDEDDDDEDEDDDEAEVSGPLVAR